MSDVRAAAERQYPVRYGYGRARYGGMLITDDSKDVWDVLHQCLEDHQMLSQAYLAIEAELAACLAEHPADENEPLTEEFVVSLNPPRYWEAGCEYAWPDVGLRYAVQIGDGRPPGLSAGFYLDAASGPVYLRHIKTRGEARELLKAMGVSHG